MNDELPANTAFFGQAAPDTGVDENGVNASHPGFNDVGTGGILDAAMFANGDFTADGYKVGTLKVERLEPNPIDVIVTVTNTAPENGTFLTPPWIAFHNGGFDTYDDGAPSSPELERIAEDGNAGPLSAAFLASGAGSDAVLNDLGPLAPGASVSRRLTIDANSPQSRYFSYVSMIIPSNDAYVANGNPTAHRVISGAGELTPVSFEILGAEVNDAGTEVNDELPANTAFFGQAAPDTGTDEDGVNAAHPGFNALGTGGILDDARFASGDFTLDGYQVAQVTVEAAPAPNLVTVSFDLVNNAPENGVFLTPVWLGVHDGTFNLFNSGEAASAGLERIAEDGNTAPLSEEFNLSSGAGLDTTVATTDGVPPFAPGESATVTLTLDSNNPKHRYLSFASMIIPSNDAFIGNSDPMAYPIFDEAGNVVLSSIMRLGADVYDAGTEVNDETPANTAFFGQAAPDTGAVEGGVIALHPGFNDVGTGGILDAAMFANADFTAEGYALFGILVTGDFSITEASLEGNVFSISWEGGQAPFQVEWSSDLRVWNNAGDITEEQSVEIEMELVDRAFFRIVQRAEAAPQEAMFEVTFDAAWSVETHPTDFPAGNPHFSGLIGATHNASASVWAPGGVASPGVRNMAETGGKTPLDSEIEALITAGSADGLLSGGGIGTSPGQVGLQFTVSQDFPLLSLTSMIAPSPDWFVGVHDLALFQDGQWVEEMVIDLDPYDAGTDDGETYLSGDSETSPQGTVSRIVAPSVLAVGDTIAPIGTFTIRRVTPLN